MKGNGFEIYSGIYSNSALSIGTTSRILEIESQISRDGRYYTSGNAFGLEILKRMTIKLPQYLNHHIFLVHQK